MILQSLVLDKVAIKIDEDEKLFGSIVIPDSCTYQQKTGTVIATGPGRVSKKGKFIPVAVGVGDRVCVPITVGQDIETTKGFIKICRELELLAVIDNEIGS